MMNMGKKMKYYVFMAGIAACAVIAIALLSRNRDNGKAESGPEETLTIFCKAMAEGDFGKAMQLCDTLTMKEHIMEYHQIWNDLQKKDSGALAIASDILKNAGMEIGQVIKDGNTREIHYTIEAGGLVIKKAASMRKEEGEWKIERIIDKY